MVIIYLVRHGESTLNREGVLQSRDINVGSLTERGRLEALCAARFLKNMAKGVGRIISSPLLRARETASIIANEIKAELIIDERVREVNMGEWEMMRISDIGPEFLKYSRDPLKHPPPGGENAEAVLGRVINMINELMEDTVVVSHYQPIASLITHVIGSSQSNIYRIRIDTGSVSAVFRDDEWGDWRVLFVNIKPFNFLNCK
ncbi:histidine phosphatase family protein [Caldivirga maquilingensis]|uniref:Phosphoglycerate mutase n=1 Tax=Caldivirga maquilingensis (strain ATCC 700844 / DSM 13496 / JCM 10307 / IC-167) TaxID=397948 RepID=A8MCQ9_CALMQ|nr:histidine phosphatase family protein [Caldivirga maquilingensis]ABW01565.1 Phosphoglycerate mutase [Caldivirga maquilingensis IC-167]